MSAESRLSSEQLEQLLRVTRRLAAPFELLDMLGEVTLAACGVLQAERASVWLLDPASGDLVLETAQGLAHARVPMGVGLIGACARERRAINVPDCYADPRFDPTLDRASGFRTRCSLTLPLSDAKGDLVGVMQVLNQHGGAFEAADLDLAEALAAQCAVALARARAVAALVEAERVRQELAAARIVQTSALPRMLPELPGYSLHASFRPAAETGGDTYDLARVDGKLLVLLADATGHGIAPALSVTQMQAMLRMALGLGVSLERSFVQVNNRLAETLPEAHFVTAFVGLLDPAEHRLRFISGGQGPILHYRAAAEAFDLHRPNCFPMGADLLDEPVAVVELSFGPGDWLLLLSDGVYEWANEEGELFGRERVMQAVRAHARAPLPAFALQLLEDLQAFSPGREQEDDVTLVLVRRDAAGE
ncbi:PP2C family protein-serine/threonine phosphatase [Ramlibacter rhizophilus]|uniref:GAF domain-containing protein n=1 Tax=Ramlibacter rhizophilus TaxID=1781167 RepID=A0A4Z0BK02_9BURK|nr:SpoIIE family protein phosphatase [Ramlibacter rhizophilus]TFY99645.1 GAF domain-containing protein [Ramlibacter rhizophilus]